MDIKSDFLDLIGRLTNKTRLQNVFQPPGMFFNLMLGDISQDLKNALREQVHMFMENDDLENWCAERYKNKKPPYVYHTINDVRVFLFCINTRYFVGWYTGKQAAVQKLNTMDRTLAIKKWNQIAQFFIEVSAEKQECAI
jgi:hypothetical protein